MRTIGRLLPSSAFLRTNRVWGSGPFRGVDEQEDALDHRQDALHLRAEVPVARRIDDVDDGVAVLDRGVLGEDRDPPLLLELARVHDELVHVLSRAERPALLQERVHERRLAVVDVRHDRERAAVRPPLEGGGIFYVHGHDLFHFHSFSFAESGQTGGRSVTV